MQQSGFEKWHKELNLLASERTGLFLSDLPPFDLEPHFEAGLTPQTCFDTVLLPELIFLGYTDDALHLVEAGDIAGELGDFPAEVASLTGSRLNSLIEATDPLDQLAALNQLPGHLPDDALHC